MSTVQSLTARRPLVAPRGRCNRPQAPFCASSKPLDSALQASPVLSAAEPDDPLDSLIQEARQCIEHMQRTLDAYAHLETKEPRR